MSEKAEAEWVIESYVPSIGWSISRLHSTAAKLQPQTLDWCMQEWTRFKSGEYRDEPLFQGYVTDPDRYRLRNVRTDDIIMCAIL